MAKRKGPNNNTVTPAKKMMGAKGASAGAKEHDGETPNTRTLKAVAAFEALHGGKPKQKPGEPNAEENRLAKAYSKVPRQRKELGEDPNELLLKRVLAFQDRYNNWPPELTEDPTREEERKLADSLRKVRKSKNLSEVAKQFLRQVDKNVQKAHGDTRGVEGQCASCGNGRPEAHHGECPFCGEEKLSKVALAETRRVVRTTPPALAPADSDAEEVETIPVDEESSSDAELQNVEMKRIVGGVACRGRTNYGVQRGKTSGERLFTAEYDDGDIDHLTRAHVHEHQVMLPRTRRTRPMHSDVEMEGEEEVESIDYDPVLDDVVLKTTSARRIVHRPFNGMVYRGTLQCTNLMNGSIKGVFRGKVSHERLYLSEYQHVIPQASYDRLPRSERNGRVGRWDPHIGENGRYYLFGGWRKYESSWKEHLTAVQVNELKVSQRNMPDSRASQETPLEAATPAKVDWAAETFTAALDFYEQYGFLPRE